MPTYDFECRQPGCKEAQAVTCKMSEKRLKWPQCSEHGDMEFIYNNKSKHVDHTLTRKGHYNSKEDGWRK